MLITEALSPARLGGATPPWLISDDKLSAKARKLKREIAKKAAADQPAA